MSIAAIELTQASTPIQTAWQPAKAKQADTQFATWLTQEMQQLNQQINGAEQQLRQLAVGEAKSIHQVMMSLEKAKLEFQFALQVRNKIVEAYQDIMRTQI